MGGRSPCESRMKTEDKGFAAFCELTDRWAKACTCLDDLSKPPWKRTYEAMLNFKGLDITHLPKRWRNRIDKTFVQINGITAPYSIETWDDYQKLSVLDLARIGKLIHMLI